MIRFVDRVSELETLGREWSSPGPKLFILYGRQRKGKTTLPFE